MKTFRGFRVFVFTYRAKNENAELAESFQNMPYRNLDFINVKQRASKFTKMPRAISQLDLFSIFIWANEIFCFLFDKNFLFENKFK